MKKVSLTRSFAGLLVALFLSVPVLSSLLSSSSEYQKTHEYSLTKNTGSHSKSDTLLPFEEKEKEERSGDTESFTFVYIISDATPYLVTVVPYSWSYTSSGYIDNTSSVPLYLSKRVLLI